MTGQIVGAAVVSHHPGLMQCEEFRVLQGAGQDSDLMAGYARLRQKITDVAPQVVVMVLPRLEAAHLDHDRSPLVDVVHRAAVKHALPVGDGEGHVGRNVDDLVAPSHLGELGRLANPQLGVPPARHPRRVQVGLVEHGQERHQQARV